MPESIFSDSKLQELYEKVVATFGELPPIIASAPEAFFGSLCESIVSQQLSTKVADVIQARVKTAIGGTWQPHAVLATSIEDLRAAGLSNAKASYVQNIARTWIDEHLSPELLLHQSDEEIITELVTIKGVGRWTAEMFLIFTLGRPDVFSVGDYGLKKAVCQLYQLDSKTIKPAQLLELSQPWQPHRSLAARILWKSLELPK